MSAADATKPAWKGEKNVWAALCSEWNEWVDWKRYGGEVAAMKEMKRAGADADAALCSEWNEWAGWKRYEGEVAAMQGKKKERADADAAVNRDGAVAQHDGATAMSDHDARKAEAHAGAEAHRRRR